MASESRKKLKTSSSEVLRLRKTIDKLGGSLARANELTAEAAESLKEFADLDKTIARFRADALKDGRDPRVLPAAFKAKLAARTVAQQEAESAQETRELIATELDDATTRLTRLNNELTPIAADVLREEVADVLADELSKISRRDWELVTVLTSFRSLTFHNGKNWQPLAESSAVSAALAGYSVGGYTGQMNPTQEMSTRWMKQLSALLADPDAPIAEIKPVRPTDYTFTDGKLHIS